VTTPQRISFGIMAAILLAVGWLHMATLMLTALFGYFALRKLSLGRSKFLAVVLFALLLAGLAYGSYSFSKHAWVTFPKIAETTIPAVVEFAEKQGVELPFTDLKSLKTQALVEVRERFANLPRYASAAVFQVVYFIIGVVIATSMFLGVKLRLDDDPSVHRDSLYARTAAELARRVNTFYRSFSRVMGAQILISAINTGLTGIFLFSAGFKYAAVLTAFTFLCGLLPIIGNIISNTLITGVGLTISPKMAMLALAFLITIHKLEYFLNSKIIGDRIKNPMWLTLIGLLLGEKLMGIPGMILAPVVLHYIKVEASRNRLDLPPEKSPEEPDDT
jgi:predicted PurR-regulated permease PerM